MAPVGMQGRYLAIFQLSLTGAATVTPTLVGFLLAANPQALWLILAPLMVGAAAWVVLLERGLPQAALLTAWGVATTQPRQETGTHAHAEICPSGQGALDPHPAE